VKRFRHGSDIWQLLSDLIGELIERFIRWRTETPAQRLARRFDEQEKAYWREILIDKLRERKR
jgi:hypothetical protein